jgi:hypothetical protein
MPEDVHFGNAARDGEQYRGWLVGHFINSGDSAVRHSQDVEIKWFLHPAGQERENWVTGETATTLCMLISGRFRINLSTGTYTLAKEGDYLMWGPGVDHLWHAEEDSTVLTIRWPSRPVRQPTGPVATRSEHR